MKLVEQALEAAPIVYLDEETISPTSNTGLEVFKHQPDDETVHWNHGTERGAKPGEIILPDNQEYQEVLQEVDRVQGMNIIGERMRHEREHVLAAHALATVQSELGVRFWRVYDNRESISYRIGSQPFARILDLTTTKLGMGTIMAHPIEPSEGDLMDLESIGYDIDEVGYKATEHNTMHDDKLAIPLSYIPSRRTYIDVA